MKERWWYLYVRWKRDTFCFTNVTKQFKSSTSSSLNIDSDHLYFPLPVCSLCNILMFFFNSSSALHADGLIMQHICASTPFLSHHCTVLWSASLVSNQAHLRFQVFLYLFPVSSLWSSSVSASLSLESSESFLLTLSCTFYFSPFIFSSSPPVQHRASQSPWWSVPCTLLLHTALPPSYDNMLVIWAAPPCAESQAGGLKETEPTWVCTGLDLWVQIHTHLYQFPVHLWLSNEGFVNGMWIYAAFFTCGGSFF